VQLPLAPVIASGHVVAASETLLATVAVGVAVRTGAPKPDISTADAVKRLLLGSKAISYPNAATGAAAGVSFNETLQKLGIADAMKPKIKIAQGGRGAMELLAKGEVDIGLTFISEIITEPGVEVTGPLPRDISTPTALVAVRVHPFEGARGRAGAAALPLVCRGCGGLQKARDATGSLSEKKLCYCASTRSANTGVVPFNKVNESMTRIIRLLLLSPCLTGHTC